MTTATLTGQEPLPVWLGADDRHLIERAAGIAGQSASDFVRFEALRSARALIGEDAVIRMTERGWEQLADFAETGADQPNEALRRAAERNADVRPLAAKPLA